MAEPFKNLINPPLVALAGAHLKRCWRGFDQRGFVAQAGDGLDTLEMKARAMQIADALEATLPADFDRAATLLEATLAPPREALSEQRSDDEGLAGWILWSFGEFIARRGLAEPERALTALHAITQRFTAEWAIRPLIVEHPALVFATLERWAADPSAHVRRLVSEGSRPRLPWGLRLNALVQDPSPTLPLLRALQDDGSEYVRRSVANHLNDIAKDHPPLVAAWLEQHLPQASPDRRALLRHASRGLIKAGDLAVLAAWGLAGAFKGEVALALSTSRVRVGESIAIRLALCSTSPRAQRLAIDYALHHVKANGTHSAKVFKGWVVDLDPHATLDLTKSHSMREITTRRYHLGLHAVDARINGRVLAEAEFELLAAR